MKRKKIPRFNIIRKHLRSISLKKKLIISYGLVLIIPLTILVYYSMNLSQILTLNNGMNVISNMTERVSERVEEKLNQMDDIIALCVYQSEMQRIYRNTGMTKYQLYLALKNYGLPFLNGVRNAVSTEIEELYVYSARGLMNKGDVFRSFDQAENAEWYDYAFDESGIKWYLRNHELYALCRIDSISEGLGKEYYGVLYLSLDFETIIRNCVEIDWDDYALVIRNNSNEVCFSRTYGVVQDKDDNLQYRIWIPNAGMSIEYTVTRASIAGYGPRTFGLNAIVILLSLAIIILLVWMMSYRIFRRIDVLKEKMLLVQNGDMNIEVENSYGDEVGILTSTFQSMLTEIKALIERVKENEKRTGQLEIRALRAQIDPHFLYNTLSYVNWLAIMKNEDEIGNIIRLISKFYRTCLNNGREFIHVDRELSNVEAYLEIALIMHDRSFDVVYEIDEDVFRYRMLCFLLQPIAENAVQHGIDRITSERGMVTVRAYCQDTVLVFEIENNGDKLTDFDLKLLSDGKGYGISNIQQRIHLCYGEEYGMSFIPRETGGLLVKLVLPRIEEDENLQDDGKMIVD